MGFSQRKKNEFEQLRRLASKISECDSLIDVNAVFTSYINFYGVDDSRWVVQHLTSALFDYLKDEESKHA